jgi:lysophospholipase L1-like esterase
VLDRQGSIPSMMPDYDQYGPTIGADCLGTAHQRIDGIERVVFLGDSITVGTPPWSNEELYRSLVADALAARFSLEPPSWQWKSYDIFGGTSGVQTSGAFSSCAYWGARTDDFLREGGQIENCFPDSEMDKRTLVIITMGGNDIFKIAERGIEGATVEELWDQTRQFVQYMRDAVEWFRTPGRFPNGVYVVFANIYEYTDGTGDLSSCPAAALAGLVGEWENPEALSSMLIWADEQFLALAVETGTDMVFMLEEFCGHGYRNTDPQVECYRGPDAERWFDLTCIHPNPLGHAALAEMFLSVVDGSAGTR